MFQQAISRSLQYTRSLHSISRSYQGLLAPGASTFFFVNDKGVAITCRHVVDMIQGSDAVNNTYAQFRTERSQIVADGKFKRNLQGLELKYKYTPESTIQIKHSFQNSFDRIDGFTCHVHPYLDLAIIEFSGFTKTFYTSHAVFLKDSSMIQQGKSLCRIGFPFPEFNNFHYNSTSDDIEWTNTGNINSPSFPIDGIVTRFVGDPNGNGITGIEMSTPGLRGQSGGPLFDSEGLVCGMQFATNHLHLGFDIRELEIISNGRRQKVSNNPFLHVGICVHVDKIKEFLREKNISFTESD